MNISFEDIAAVKKYLNGKDIIGTMAKAGLTFIQIDLIISTALKRIEELEDKILREEVI